MTAMTEELLIWMSDTNARLDRIEEAVGTMAWWLVDAQTGFGEQDAQGIDKILKKEGK